MAFRLVFSKKFSKILGGYPPQPFSESTPNDGSELINHVSHQKPFQYTKHTIVIKFNIPSALVESQHPVHEPKMLIILSQASLSLTFDFE